MKTYEVTLMATSYKTVEISAESEQQAKSLAHDMYFHTDALDFTDEDVEELAVQADEMEPTEDEKAKHDRLCDELDDCIREAHFAIDDLERAIEAIRLFSRDTDS